MSETAIQVDGLSKRYRIGKKRDERDTLVGRLTGMLKRPVRNFRRLRKLSRFDEDQPEERDDIIWALRDLSFEVDRGEVVGVIGSNGAGKTTLLKVLSRITEPTSGQAVIRGRVSSLLEVGTGFHPELTGRENVFLNGAVLGMTHGEIEEKFDEIVEFSGVERFIDTPVKRYSSGMRVRLAFAVAAHLEPEILLVDEVLAVGDAAFQKKCLGKMDSFGGGGRTVLFISHNMGLIRRLCDRSLLLADGRLVADGPSEAVISQYLEMTGSADANGEVEWSDPEEAPGDQEIRLRGIRLLGPDGSPQGRFDLVQPIRVEITYDVEEPVRGMRMNVHLVTPEGVTAFASSDHDSRPERRLDPGRYRAVCTIPGALLNRGRYFVHVHAGIPGVKVLVQGREFLSFETIGSGTYGSTFDENWPGVVAPELDWEHDRVAARATA